MATVGLAVVGNLIAPGIGGALGAALGGYIDNQFIFPAVFGADTATQEGPRLDQLQLQSASEGSPQKRLYGPKNRVSGTIIWAGNIREQKITEEVGGGKGGGKPAGVTVTYVYFIDVAVAICRGPINKVNQIKGDQRVIYQAARTYDVTTALASMTNLPYQQGPPRCTITGPDIGTLSLTQNGDAGLERTVVLTGFGNAANNGTWRVVAVNSSTDTATLEKAVGAALFVNETSSPTANVSQTVFLSGGVDATGAFTIVREEPEYLGRIEVDEAGPDFSEFLRDDSITISGFANAANNGTFTVTSARTESNGDTTIEVKKEDTTPFVDEAAGATVNAVQSQAEIQTRADNITVYLGDETQTADPTISAFEDDVPAFRGTAYVVFENLSLTDFGNRIPNFNFEVEADEGGNPPFTSFTVGDAIEAILARSGYFTSDQYDASACTEELQGYVVPGPQSIIQQLEPLLLTFDIATYERDGTLYFIPREDTDVGEITDQDLGAASIGSSPAVTDIQFEVPSGLTLPKEVTVEYSDPNLNLQVGAVRERRINTAADNIENVRLPITLDANRARGVAQRVLWRPWAEQQRVTFSLPPRFSVWLKEGDRLKLTFNGEDYVIRVQTLDIGANRVVEVTGVVELDVDTDTLVTDETRVSSLLDQAYRAPTIQLHILNLAPLITDHATVAGYYFAVAASDPAAEYLGGTLFDSVDGSQFTQLANFPPETAMGVATTALDDAPTTTEWDETSSVTVELIEGSLTSATDAQVLSGNTNLILIGDEILAFRTATLIATRTYTLTGFIRAWRNTEAHSTGHAIGDRVVLLSGVLEFVSINTTLIDTARVFKAVGAFGDLNDASAISRTLTGETIKPFGPTAVTSSRNGSGDITISFQRRSRDLVKFGGAAGELLDSPEAYEVDVLDGLGDVVRTLEDSDITVNNDGTASALYTATDQVTDGFTAGDPRDVVLYQISATVGRGNPTEATV